MQKFIFFILFGCIAISISGCAGFKANELTRVKNEDLQFTSTNKTKVFSRWKSGSEDNATSVSAAALHKNAFDKIMIASGCCTIVEGPKDAEVEITGNGFPFENESWARMAGAISGSTLGIIPTWVTADIHISADAKRGAISKSYDLKDSSTIVLWLPMVVAFPFANPAKAETETKVNTYLTLISNMKRDGLLN